jgi:hypothetical protein
MPKVDMPKLDDIQPKVFDNRIPEAEEPKIKERPEEVEKKKKKKIGTQALRIEMRMPQLQSPSGIKIPRG